MGNDVRFHLQAQKITMRTFRQKISLSTNSIERETNFKFMRFIFSILIIAVCGLSIFARTKTPDFAELEKVIEAELAATKTPGAAVAIVSGDRIIFAKGFGVTSAEDGRKVSADTLFRMGSTTKMFTAAALLTLAGQGRLRLDAPVGNYIKNLPPKIAALTAHQLLSQSSGLRDFAPLASGNDAAALGQNIRLWKDDVFFTDSDKIYSYSSANYWLAGFITEELYGKPYQDAMAELVFKPLGMTRSTIDPLVAMTYPLALGHSVSGEKAALVRPIDNNAAKYPGGSMFSSAEELARWSVAMLNGGRIDGKQSIPAAVVEKLHKPQFYLPGEEKAFYGYGLLGYEQQGVKTVSHGGASRGYGSFITFAPEQKIAVVVLANVSGQTLPKTQQKALEMLLPLKPAPPTAGEEVSAPTAGAAELQKFAGKYEHAPQTWEFFVRGGKLFVKEGGKEFELKQTGTNEFLYEQGGFLFVPDERGEIEHIFMGLYAARKIS
jgi:CubicO group peptidase (beta-lactamase class C family)